MRRVVAATTGQGPFGFERSEAFWCGRSSQLNHLGETACAAGLSLLYRHGQHEFLRSSTGTRVLDLLASRIEPRLVQLSVDVCQSARVGIDPMTLLEHYPVGQLLLSNYGPDGDGMATTLTDGFLDIRKMAALCPSSTDLVIDLTLPSGAEPSSPAQLEAEIDTSLAQLVDLLQPQTGARDV